MAPFLTRISNSKETPCFRLADSSSNCWWESHSRRSSDIFREILSPHIEMYKRT